MKKFRSLEEVERAGPPTGTFRFVHGILKFFIDAYEEYVLEDDSYIVLPNPGDMRDAA